jgi:hypothetical protein
VAVARKEKKMGTTLSEYPSKSNPNKTYQIVRGNDGKTYCTCWQWKLHRNCSHLEDFLHSAGAKPYKVRKTTTAGKVDTYLDLEAAIQRAVAELN